LASRNTVPAVEYRNLIVQLGLRLELDPDNAELRQFMQDLVAIGDEAGALTLKLDASEDVFPFTDGAHPVSTFDWDNGEIPISSRQGEIVERISEITRVPE
jgi:hypothetical protein